MAEKEKPYYEAYDDRYRAVHSAGELWFSPDPTPILGEMTARLGLGPGARLLELGCGEGRDAGPLLAAGYDLTATDVSPAAVACCRARYPAFAGRFRVLDAAAGELAGKFDFIYAVAVLHMLVEDRDRLAFLRFIRDHLADGGAALVCSMGDGVEAFRTDPAEAFCPVKRRGPRGEMTVAATSCRVEPTGALLAEARRAGLTVLEHGLTACQPDFPEMIYLLCAGGDAPE